jgi:hypothetical protein
MNNNRYFIYKYSDSDRIGKPDVMFEVQLLDESGQAIITCLFKSVIEVNDKFKIDVDNIRKLIATLTPGTGDYCNDSGCVIDPMR